MTKNMTNQNVRQAQLGSIWSFPERGPWGKSSYRGNCSGHVIKELLQFFKPKRFVEVFAGSGTGRDVAKEMGFSNSVHLDLRPEFGGWNALADEIPVGSDFAFSHPPYDRMVVYSGEQWGQPNPHDLSRCSSWDEFIHKLNLVNEKIYHSLVRGGRHAILVGDWKQNGKMYSMQKDMAWFGDLEYHLIKNQHNTMSERKVYNGNFIPTTHEHLLVFKKNEIWMFPVKVTKKFDFDIRSVETATWRDLVQAALQHLGGKAVLSDIYKLLQSTKKALGNQNWQAKIRQTLQICENFKPLARGEWALSV
ncbi:DNA methylase N-4/N-6 [Cytobacillus sp. FJAT-54145]|uniref:DNA methylase N-4/N-6 n=1 Tax=Cytobacillus spartinae TaxID=3299023 RepID=A0ABW6KA63_9BACI